MTIKLLSVIFLFFLATVATGQSERKVSSKKDDSGMSKVDIGGKYGYIDDTGTEVIPCKYDYIGRWSHGKAKVKIGDFIGFIDKKGNEFIPIKYINIGSIFIFVLNTSTVSPINIPPKRTRGIKNLLESLKAKPKGRLTKKL